MATPVYYSPQSVIARAVFNFDAFGEQNFVLSGTVRVSVSDSFSSSDYVSPSYSAFYGDLWTPGSGEVIWSAEQLRNIQDVLAIYSRYANISFQWNGNYDVSPSGSDTTFNPEDVGRSGLSDINISLISRTNADFSGISGISADSILGYTGSAADIFVNSAAFGDLGFGAGTRARQTLLHELGHSLGMSHPHVDDDSTHEVATVAADFAATRYLGFENLGFASTSAADMNKEYFTIMSYDDQLSLSSNISSNAHTPMILDVIALQEAYGGGYGHYRSRERHYQGRHVRVSHVFRPGRNRYDGPELVFGWGVPEHGGEHHRRAS